VTEPLHVVAVTGFVADAGGRILLVRVLARGWELPGGQVEEGEWPEVAWFDPEEARRVTHPPSAERLADALFFSGEAVYRAYRLRPYESLHARRI
jgi:8-oxo-dGTP pyrophosphatase MutT (NUDIX family)